MSHPAFPLANFQGSGHDALGFGEGMGGRKMLVVSHKDSLTRDFFMGLPNKTRQGAHRSA